MLTLGEQLAALKLDIDAATVNMTDAEAVLVLTKLAAHVRQVRRGYIELIRERLEKSANA